ncbi:MAG: MBL fold metallo-hydrolase [Planctomycetes bacterium]|nr:MBL fold metallo-hydrolase [Planctomycetota bacterium]
MGYMRLAGAANAFLIRGDDGHVLVECGPAATRATLFEGLRAVGVALTDIRHLLLTHIHLDHAGAAGHLAQHGAHVHVHPFGAPHLANPEKLLASTRRVHGSAYEPFYGDMAPVDVAHLHATTDDVEVRLSGRAWRALHTPGHARHHVVWLLEAGSERHAFMGDLAGIVVPDSDWLSVPTPPPEFEPDAWIASLQRVIEADPTHLWLTHGAGVARDRAASRRFLERALLRLRQERAWLEQVVSAHADDAQALDTYRAIESAHVRAAGMEAARLDVLLDDAFFRMNLAGARRAFAPREPRG